MRFTDRHDAGRRLAAALAHLKDRRPVVLALPRGGVPIGYEVAAALAAPLDLVLVRKIGAPFQPELAIGAVVDVGIGGDGFDAVFDDSMIATFGIPQSYLDEAIAEARAEIERRRALYFGGRQPVPLAGTTAIVVDDGIATGASMAVALRAVQRRGPAALVLAVPVAAADTLDRLRAEVDEVVCLDAPEDFDAVGRFYADFRQTTDDEVRALLARAAGTPS